MNPTTKPASSRVKKPTTVGPKPRTPLTKAQERSIASLYKKGSTFPELTKKFGRSVQVIRRIIVGNSIAIRPRGPKVSLTPTQLGIIKRRYDKGAPLAELAKQFDVGTQTVRKVLVAQGVTIRANVAKPQA